MNGEIGDVDPKISNVEYVDPNRLLEHKLNGELYGSAIPPADYLSSVQRHGVITPLIVSQSYTVISGHRRRRAAIVNQAKTVPVFVWPEALSDEELRLLLIECNRDREKTVEEKAREYKELLRIEKILAAKRQKSGEPSSKKDAGRNKGKAKRVAAEKVGLSEPTADKASEVVDAIDRAVAAGDTAKASELREKLQHRSVASAHRAAKPDATVLRAETATDTPAELDALGVPIPRRLARAFAICTRFGAVLGTLRNLQAEANKVAGLPGGEILKERAQSIEIDLKNVRAGWRFAQPYCVCPDCNASGKDCGTCNKRGWIVEDVYTRNFKKRLQPGRGSASSALQRT
jgi:ParB-like chromosome segregation protein Spo0J